MTMKFPTATLLLCLGIAACANGYEGNNVIATRPTQPPSGITAANGGGQRALGDIPNIGITTGVGGTGITDTRGPSKAGTAY